MNQWRKQSRAGLVGVLLASATMIAFAQDTDTRPDRSDQRESGPVYVITARELNAHPELYFGKRVRVSSAVNELYGSSVFSLDNGRWLPDFGTDPSILVVVSSEFTPPTESEQVTVTGTFHQFIPDRYQRRAEWSDRPAIVAESIQTRRGRELVQNAAGSGDRNSAAQVRVVTAGDIAVHPEKYYGQMVQVRSEVTEAYDKHTFTLNEDRPFAGPDVLVLVPQPKLIVPEGRTVTVRGKLRPFNAPNFKHDYDWFTSEMSGTIQSISDADSHRPVIIAQSVRTGSGREYVQNADRPRGDGGAGSTTRSESGHSSGND